jgi:hypothetical protein
MLQAAIMSSSVRLAVRLMRNDSRTHPVHDTSHMMDVPVLARRLQVRQGGIQLPPLEVKQPIEIVVPGRHGRHQGDLSRPLRE